MRRRGPGAFQLTARCAAGAAPLAPRSLREGGIRTLLKGLENLPHSLPSFLSSGGLEMLGFFLPHFSIHTVCTHANSRLVFQALTATHLG